MYLANEGDATEEFDDLHYYKKRLTHEESNLTLETGGMGVLADTPP